MATTGSTKSPFEKFYGDKPKIIGSFSYSGCIAYVTKSDKIMKLITDKTYKASMVGYAENHTRDTFKLHNPETKRVIMTRVVNWVELKITDPAETLKTFRNSHKEGLVPGIEEYKIPMSDPEDKLPVNVIPDEEEIVRSNENSKLSEFAYHKKDANTDTS